MKVSTKLFVLIAATIVLFIFSFGVNSYFNRTVQAHYDLRADIKDFEISLLQTIVSEKEYSRHPDGENASKTLDESQTDLALLNAMLRTRASEQKEDMAALSEGLLNYQEAFNELARNNERIALLKRELDQLFETLHAKSAQAAGKADVLIGMAYIDGFSVDPGLNSFVATNKNIVASVIEIVLAVNRDLLLNNDEKTYRRKYEKAFEDLRREGKNVRPLTKNIGEASLNEFADHVQDAIPNLSDLLNTIFEIWTANNAIVARLNGARLNILEKTAEISAQSDETLAGKRKQIFSLNMFSSFVALFLLIGFGMYTRVSIVRPVKDTVNRLKDIVEGEGDLTARLEAQGRDEMSELARWFNRFVENIEELIVDIVENINTLNAAADDLNELSVRFASGSEEMSGQANNVAGATEQMSASINAMASAAEEMSANAHGVSSTAEQLSVNMNAVASSIEEMSMAVKEVEKTAEEGSKIAGQTLELSDSATHTMNLLGSAAGEIGQVTTLIKRIAEQTNLLALNATIEAASAGDAGKGFAVVANEIKELARQSAGAAEDIGKRIEGIQANTDEAVRAITEVSGAIKNLNDSSRVISRSVAQQTVTANEISGNVQQANTGVNNIASAISEIAKGTEEVAKNAGEAAKGVNDVSLNIQGVSKAAADSNADARLINASADKLTAVAGLLRDMAGKFKVKKGGLNDTENEKGTGKNGNPVNDSDHGPVPDAGGDAGGGKEHRRHVDR